MAVFASIAWALSIKGFPETKVATGPGMGRRRTRHLKRWSYRGIEQRRDADGMTERGTVFRPCRPEVLDQPRAITYVLGGLDQGSATVEDVGDHSVISILEQQNAVRIHGLEIPLISEVAVMVLMPNAPSRSNRAAKKALKSVVWLWKSLAQCRARLLISSAIGDLDQLPFCSCRER